MCLYGILLVTAAAALAFTDAAGTHRHEAAIDVDAEVNTDCGKLQSDQLNGWLSKEKSVNDVFRLLKLSADRVGNPKMKMLEDYVTLFSNKRNGHVTLLKTFKTEVVSALSTGIGSEGKLATFLVRTKEIPQIEPKVNELQLDQFKEWSARGVTPSNLLTSVFHVNENGASDLQKTVVSEYQAFYGSNTRNSSERFHVKVRRGDSIRQQVEQLEQVNDFLFT
ncbi:unnamed protein product [Phytophthora lilii]|uniref:Unnamed protein product n=1 Tax=Phytophthora lilii TaxID=2077276 RepID=A0A9W6TR09_9STRA|nr:unnamed protein product [Phytophthora lilii]